MAAPSVTNTFVAGTTASASQVNQNFTDVIDAMTDETGDLAINSLALPNRTVSTGDVGYTLSASDLHIDTILIGEDATLTANKTVSLPAATAGRMVAVKKMDTSNFAVRIDCSGVVEECDGITFNDNADAYLKRQYDAILFISDGSNWRIVGRRAMTAWQTRALTLAITAPSTDVTDLKFTNLIVGRQYRATLRANVSILGTSSAEYASIELHHDSADIARWVHRVDGANEFNQEQACGVSVMFVATNTTLIVQVNMAGTVSIYDGAENTALTLEELSNDFVNTTDLA